MSSGGKWKLPQLEMLEHSPVSFAAHFSYQDSYYTIVHANEAEWVLLSMDYCKCNISSSLMITDGCGI